MAQRTQVILIDDVDQSAADETVTFALDGVTYEIDLSSANANTLRSDLARWVGHARRTGGRKSTGATAAKGKSREELAKVREWARSAGHVVSDRGRISASIQEAYDRAHG